MREVREDGGTNMAAVAISADADGPSLDSIDFYWVGAVRSDVQILEGDRDRRRVVIQPFNHTA